MNILSVRKCQLALLRSQFLNWLGGTCCCVCLHNRVKFSDGGDNREQLDSYEHKVPVVIAHDDIVLIFAKYHLLFLLLVQIIGCRLGLQITSH